MKFTYDPQYNIAYIRFRAKSSETGSVKISEELVIDMASDGTVYGIELLNANEQLQADDEGRFLFVNEKTGVRADIPLLT